MAEPHENVWRDVLTPTVFLERTRRAFPDRVAVIHGNEEWRGTGFGDEVRRIGVWPQIRSGMRLRSEEGFRFPSGTGSRSSSVHEGISGQAPSRGRGPSGARRR